MKIRILLEKSAEELSRVGISEARQEASSLLSLSCGLTRTEIIADPDRDLSATQIEAFHRVLARRLTREPLQYIRNRTEFFGLEFDVDPRVLIPRPETEILVEKSIELLDVGRSKNFCEIGVGSGCIAISVLKSVGSATCVAVDKSPEALELAKDNSLKHLVSERLDLRISDLFEKVLEYERFDLIVSNPPYISIEDFSTLQPEVREFEPRLALTDENDGLSIIQRLVSDSENHLTPGGFLLIEIGHDQKSAVQNMFSASNWQEVFFLQDLQGHNRVVVARIM